MNDNLIPIFVVVVLPVLIVLIVCLTNYFKQKRRIELIEKAVEAKVDLPPEVLSFVNPSPAPKRQDGRHLGFLVSGLCSIGMGIGLGLLLWFEVDWRLASVGLMVFMVGLALLAVYFIEAKKHRD